MCLTTEGSSIEVGNVGNEGMVGIPVLHRRATSPHEVVVLVPGEALAVTTDILEREFNKEGELKNRLLSYSVEAGLNSTADTKNWKAGNKLGQELKSEGEDEAPASESQCQASSTPLFVSGNSEGNQGNAQDEKDETEE